MEYRIQRRRSYKNLLLKCVQAANKVIVITGIINVYIFSIIMFEVYIEFCIFCFTFSCIKIRQSRKEIRYQSTGEMNAIIYHFSTTTTYKLRNKHKKFNSYYIRMKLSYNVYNYASTLHETYPYINI